MKFGQLELHNFRQFDSATLDLDTGGVWLIYGENKDSACADNNMSGKTSLLEALYYVLFGETLKNDSVRDIARWEKAGGDGSGEVHLTFESAGQVYEIIRGWNGKTTQCQLIDGYSGQQIAKGREATAMIYTMLGVTAATFKRTSFLCRNLENRLTSLSDKEIKTVLESMAPGLEVFSVAQKIASKQASLQGKQAQELTLQLTKLDGALDNETKVLASIEASIDEIGDTKAKEQQLFDDIEQLESDVKELTANELSHVNRQESLEKDQDEVAKRLDRARNDLSKLDTQLAKYTTELDSAKAQRNQQQRLIDQGKCPTCKGTTDQERCPDLHHDVESLDMMIFSRKEVVEELQTSRKSAQEQVSALSSEHTALKHEISLEQSRRREAAMATAKAVRRLDGAKSDLTVIQSKRESLERQRESSLKRLKTLQEQRYELSPQVDQANASEAVLRFWSERGFGTHGLQAAVMPVILDNLNGALARYSRAITRGDATLMLDAKRQLVSGDSVDEIEVKIVGSDEKYESWSSGQQRRGDIAIHLALSELASAYSGFSSSVLVLDEIDQGLDQLGMEGLVDALYERARAGVTVFLVTHNPNLSALVDRKIVVTREGGVSRISYHS